MFKELLFLILFIASALSLSFAKDDPSCSSWTKEDGVICIFAGRDANSYTRQCDDACRVVVYGQPKNDPNCNREQACHFNNPSTFKSNCSEWIQVDGVICQNSNSGAWQQQWARACTTGFKDIACSSEMPQE